MCNNKQETKINPKNTSNISLESKYKIYRTLYYSICALISLYLEIHFTTKYEPYTKYQRNQIKKVFKDLTRRILYGIIELHTQTKPHKLFNESDDKS